MIPSSTPQILLLAHDQSLADIQRLNLETLGCQLWQATSFQQARRLLASKPLALLIMTRQLPDGDMLGRCQMLRQEYPNLPLLLLGESDNEADVVLALEAGADDYLLQSCGTLEIRARIRAWLRRGEYIKLPGQQLEFNGLSINSATREVKAFGRSLQLTAREFDLLLFMAKRPRQVFSRMQLLQGVWGSNYAGYEHTVNSHINRLRTKLAACPKSEPVVTTVWGVGYKFSPPEQASHY
ncbi:response regulator transcription factor [Shewanella algae]|uniref:response regulator transcription factor n=1 Tax=Shewanella algae TaxID=38313 RepID=UPI00222E92FE|nr:response regulator transcription factor [Shewanella algae]UZD58992.1 response regulator transcription factor [Shewanella algae]